MAQSIDPSIITKVGLLGESCPNCGPTDGLSARPNSAGKTSISHNKCGHMQELDVPWTQYVTNCIKGGWIRYGVDGSTLVDPTRIRPGMEKAVFREPGAKGKEGCFIATAVYGEANALEVDELRMFRDRVLLKSGIGRSAVTAYYLCSPPIARFLSRSAWSRRMARAALDRFVKRLSTQRHSER